MNQFLQTIEALNRKERFFLFTYATGNFDFTLSEQFREDLSAKLDVTIPGDAKAYIDYHLDWLHAATFLSRGINDGPVWPNREDPPVAPTSIPLASLGVSNGNQQDIDLLIAFEDSGTTWVLLVEAKAATGWANKPLASKARHLGTIFGDGVNGAVDGLRPRFCLLSPRRPVQIVTDGWPEWMLKPAVTDHEVRQLNWLCLPVPGRKKPIGCTERGTPSKERRFWTLVDVKSVSEVIVE